MTRWDWLGVVAIVLLLGLLFWLLFWASVI